MRIQVGTLRLQFVRYVDDMHRTVDTPPTSVRLARRYYPGMQYLTTLNTARTFPASGVFSSSQTALYSAVLQAQKYLITLCTELTWLSLAQIHRESCEALKKELSKIGFNLDGLEGKGDLERVLYPHYVGHPLGIGVWILSNLASRAIRMLLMTVMLCRFARVDTFRP